MHRRLDAVEAGSRQSPRSMGQDVPGTDCGRGHEHQPRERAHLYHRVLAVGAIEAFSGFHKNDFSLRTDYEDRTKDASERARTHAQTNARALE
jgi:hypothetical protein